LIKTAVPISGSPANGAATGKMPKAIDRTTPKTQLRSAPGPIANCIWMIRKLVSSLAQRVSSTPGLCHGVLVSMLLEGVAGARRLNVRTAYWLIIFIIVSVCVVVRQADPGFMARLRLLGFDLLQQSLPRAPDTNYPVRIIDIDEGSIKAF